MTRRPDQKWLAHLAVFAAAFAAALWIWIEVSLAPPDRAQWAVESEEVEAVLELVEVSAAGTGP